MSRAKLKRPRVGRVEAPAAPLRHLTWHGFPAVLHHRFDGCGWVVAEGPLGLLAETLLCFPPVTRNDFTIGFAFVAESERKQ